ncbi:tRNA threonylcarbamoyladenosine biosynthesis protein TsaB [Methylomagnum ishizawai]|uniref:tRNA threonylcarbamoyladenosine biosynthesis protein TsaB n=1 Tax=Methylomagnum ishizawai TaxID=1760988 RepID=A0A1Y6D4Q7_9GAMM|nr:tRNA (adenosine(37)-N6)-threonylcarbamoyltransferase complex dimerization subunit type 1 TsaB [Methylomagnum ishizawai]SMF95522.1 tRNA threonylcarbamoyladenosine biosynthesis protein TsaB [Methylomagnum ishizawai]
MNLLAIETATEACSAALLVGDQLIERYQLAPRLHNSLILPMVDELLAEAGLVVGQLDALAFGRGPGSFTGVRIAAGVAQGIAFGADLPVVPVSTLAALAEAALAATGLDTAFPCIDARMGEVYWAVYRRGGTGWAELLGEEAVLPAEQASFPEAVRGVATGSGWATYGAVLGERLGGRVLTVLEGQFPRAGFVARLGAAAFQAGVAVPVEQVQPIYLRDNVAKKPQLPSLT